MPLPWFFRIISKEKYIYDFVLLTIIAFISYVLASAFDVFENFVKFIRHYEAYEADELLVVALVLSFGLVWFSFRRWKEMSLAKQSLQESEEKYRELIENINEVVFSIDEKGTITYLSPLAETTGGYQPAHVIGKPFADFVYKDDLPYVTERFIKIVTSGQIEPSLYRIVTKEGEVRWITSNSRPIYKNGRCDGLTGSYVDVTEKRDLEAKLAQSQKMEDIGTLAGGIAHDFNNILSIIMGNAEMMQIDLASERGPMNESLREILTAAQRAKGLVRQILTFSRQTTQETKPLLLASIVTEAVKFLRSSLPSTIDIQQDIETEAEKAVILADSTQMHQVIMNLCANAAHAMGKTGGKLRIGLAQIDIGTGDQLRFQDLEPGRYLQLEVSDTGHGMTPDVMKKIFEPYFSTKPIGEGSGLGLAVVHGIVKAHGGAVTVESWEGRGSTFRVYLPVAQEGAIETEAAPRKVPTGNETILFVDDEPQLTAIGQKMLEKLGYRVFGKTDSSEALAEFKKNPEKFDLVITDMTMPGMTGDKLAQELIKIRDDIPVLMCTGYNEFMTEQKAKAMGIKGFLLKPVIRNVLAESVRKALDN